MAETWEIILWVIVAAAIVILLAIAIATFIVWRKRSQRKKNIKHQRFEWERKDEMDSGKRKVSYNASSGEAKILDQTDSGKNSSKQAKVEYHAKTEEAKILGVGDKGFEEEKVAGGNAKNSNDDIPRVSKSNTSQEPKSFSETYESRKTEVKNGSVDEVKGDYVRLQAAPVQRERLQPIEILPRETAMTSAMMSKNMTSENMTSRVTSSKNVASRVTSSKNVAPVKSYTNLGYSQTGQNRYLMSNVQFQQPVAVVKAFVNPGHSTTSLRQARTLPRNYSKLNYKKSFTTSTMPRRKPILYTWSLKATDSDTRQPYLKLPIAYNETLPCSDRRRSTRHRSSMRSRSFTRRSLRKQKAKKYGSLNGVYITDSRPRASYQEDAESSRNYERSMRPSGNKFITNADYNFSTPQNVSRSDRRNHGDFYEEHYKMVKKSEFPAFQSSSSKYEAESSRDIEPEISSIVSGSEFSDFLPTPPRPSESQSDSSGKGYSRGSFKAYKSRLEKSNKGKSEVIMEERSEQDRAKHTKSFQETLKSLKNGIRKDQYRVKHEVSPTNETASPWVNNDSSFRKEHGVPISGVAVLPPEPVFIQVEDSDQSDFESPKTDDTN